MRFELTTVVSLGLVVVVHAKNVVITVGANTTNNASQIFQPDTVVAFLGDVVMFIFTNGNHTATEAEFASPCIPANVVNSSRNGFDSGFQDTDNGTVPHQTVVPITADIQNLTMFFYDYNTCGEGGVGVINVNASSGETLAGFERNAIRLNGTASSSTSSGSQSATSSDSSTSSSASATSSDTNSAATLRMYSLGPLVVAVASLVVL